MNKSEQFIGFLESLKNGANDALIESVVNGFVLIENAEISVYERIARDYEDVLPEARLNAIFNKVMEIKDTGDLDALYAFANKLDQTTDSGKLANELVTEAEKEIVGYDGTTGFEEDHMRDDMDSGYTND